MSVLRDSKPLGSDFNSDYIKHNYVKVKVMAWDWRLYIK